MNGGVPPRQVYIPDRESLIRRPDLCLRARNTESVAVVVPTYVLTKFDDYQLGVLRSLVLGASDAGFLSVVDTPVDTDLKRERKANLSRLQQIVLDTAQQYRAQGNAVTVVTSSGPLTEACKAAVIRVATPTEAATSLPALDLRDTSLKILPTAARRLAKYQGRQLLLQAVFASLLLGVVTQWSALWRATVSFYTSSVLAAVAMCVVLAIAIFALRSKFRFTYAICEIGIGTGLILTTLGSAPSTLTADQALKVAGGIYVIVRGLDNVGKALAGTRLGLWWWRLFGE